MRKIMIFITAFFSLGLYANNENIPVVPAKIENRKLLQTITGAEEISHQIAVLQRMCGQGACMRSGDTSVNLGSIGAAGLQVSKIKIFDIKGNAHFQSEIVLETVGVDKRPSSIQLNYLISYPVTRESADTENDLKGAKKKEDEKDWP